MRILPGKGRRARLPFSTFRMKCYLAPYRRDIGLLLLRLVLGAVMISAGIPKLLGGTEMWTAVGSAMGGLGVTFAPAFWGFMAMFAELVGGAAILVGICTMPAGLLVAFTMLVASVSNGSKVESLSWNPGMFINQVGITIPLGVMALALALTGPGKISLKKLLCKGGSCSGQAACK